MNKEIRDQVTNLAKFIFSDEEFIKVMNYLGSGKLNDLRLYIAMKYELLSALQSLNPGDNVLSYQVALCDELEDLVMDTYLENA